MGFRKDTWAKVWEVQPKTDTITSLRISIGRKDKNTGEYEDEFSGFVSCIGTAVAKKAAGLKVGDRIRLGDVDVKNRYVKEKDTTYNNFNIYSFEVNEENETPAATTDYDPQPEVDNGEIDDSLPF